MSGSVRTTLVVLLLVVAGIFSFVLYRQMHLASAEPEPAPDLAEYNAYVYTEARPLAEFTLTDEQGEPTTREDLKGRWTFAFVGYTSCPDICPMAMTTLRQMDGQLPAELPQPQYLLISADPEHDTPERLKNYTAFFGEHFHGLTGDLEKTRELAKSMSAVFQHRKEDGQLLVDHSGHFALLNPEAEVQALIQPPHNPQHLLKAYERIYQWARANRERDSRG